MCFANANSNANDDLRAGAVVRDCFVGLVRRFTRFRTLATKGIDMTKRARLTGFLLFGAASAGIGLHGCGTGLTVDSTIGDVLSVLTSGDLAAAFDAFASASGAPGDGLSDDQIAAIEDLQASFDAGSLSATAFDDGVDSIMGRRAHRPAIGGFGFGGPRHGMRRLARLNALLELTDDQQAQADMIFSDMHAAIQMLRETAKADIRAELTEEQLATLDSLRPAGIGAAADDSVDGASRQVGHRRGGPGSLSSRFAELLDLTDDQQAAIDAIRTALREAVRAEHEAARAAFRAILTEAQIAVLDEFEMTHMHGMETDMDDE